jgi:hypothetical protein
MHVLPALRPGAREHEAANEPRPDERQLLRHEPAEREPEHVHLPQLECLEEPQRVVRHRGHGARGPTGRSADPGVVEQDHLARGSKGVDERGVPVVEVAAEVLQQHERRGAGRVAEPPIRVRDAIGGFDSAVGGGEQGFGSEHRRLRAVRVGQAHRRACAIGSFAESSRLAWRCRPCRSCARCTQMFDETIAPTASFMFAADAGSTFECALDAEPLAECQSPVEYSDLAPGDHTFTVVAADVPKARSGKIMRRLLRDIAEGREPGDVTTLREPGVMKDLEARFADQET